MALPEGSDQTTATDKSLLAAATTTDLPLVSARHSPGMSEHPAGYTETEPADAQAPDRANRRIPRSRS